MSRQKPLDTTTRATGDSRGAPFPFDNRYAALPEKFFARLPPEPVRQPAPLRVNRELAARLGLDADWLASDEGTRVLAGNELPEGADPIATVYAGHQFGSFNPQLGDGRAILLGEVVAPDGARFDIQLKGSGPTPWSRGGDGRAPLGPVLREYIVSEAMHRLGVPTTRALAAVQTGEPVVRERALPGAVLTRVASSHIRIGTLQYFAARRDVEALRQLCEHVIDRHYPGARDAANPMLALLEGVIARQASLIAQWQLLGFIHGVMNTDNMLLCGETIDYGPCAFMDQFDPAQVYSSIDHGGRYAYRNQPGIAHWNLSCLAQAMLPLLDEDQERGVTLAQGAIDAFPGQFLDAHAAGLADKLGLSALAEGDTALVEDLFKLMAEHSLDFTLTFRQLADLAEPDGTAPRLSDDFAPPDCLDPWLARWRERVAQDPLDGAARQLRMYGASPAFIPRNHQVEKALDAASQHGDFEPFQRLLAVLGDPWTYRHADAEYARPPESHEIVRQTFCGT